MVQKFSIKEYHRLLDNEFEWKVLIIQYYNQYSSMGGLYGRHFCQIS